MNRIPSNYMERLYAGWLAKIIGIRLGAAIEGWTYEKIQRTYGELVNYPVDYNDFAADDDSNGPLFFLRALLHKPKDRPMVAQDVADALLNYAPYEHGFFWWGGYGVSTEHTAYLNLRHGIPAPRSGSVAQNGAAVAEQIGGQIFIDTWGLVAPGNPELAAKLAWEAASVTHGDNGIYGGVFIAVCISLAFVEKDIKVILKKALSYIPVDCEYARVVKAVIDYHQKQPNNWRDCFHYIHTNFGYDKYPGNCHIIPNIAVMILSLLYGNKDFSDTINICNMCGWDTDCNVGNVATIIGVLVGVEGIEYDRWIKPTKDLVICSSVVGSLNIMDVPYGASFIAKMAYELANEEIPVHFNEIINNRIHSAHFEYPASTHAMRVRSDLASPRVQTLEHMLLNTDEAAFTGKRSLKMMIKPVEVTQQVYLYQKTYYQPEDLHDSRYDPCFSPTLYPGQTVKGAVMIPETSFASFVRLYAKNLRSDELILGKRIRLENNNQWTQLELKIPRLDDALLSEVGFLFEIGGERKWMMDFVAYVDDLVFTGAADYSIDYAKEKVEFWNFLHTEISQMTRLRGILNLEGGKLNLSGSEYAEAYTGHYQWDDYKAIFNVIPVIGEMATVNFRVQGAIRSYAFGFNGTGQLSLLKNKNGYQTLSSCPFDWEYNKPYQFNVEVRGNRIVARCGEVVLSFQDDEDPYLWGQVGLSVREGTRMQLAGLSILPV